ncbi:hypothetical protein B0T21DRAFT_366442 [Apiosordaria backusii]|uniref:F-box domain-containing protein n=1 Tax=Apiosordaria backusii TaxID=314023 RepID=A0AA40EF81_9PEZI|nr:hypothetical protein B0T21DRAFT_366442 [Apiosordaria backusii]
MEATTTTTPPPQPPPPTALQIPEILSQIFLHLPPSHLITSITRVSRLWHSVLETDPLLQRHLFFLPDPGWTSYPSFIPSPRKINPFFKSVFSVFFHPAFLGEMGALFSARFSPPHSNGTPQEGRLAHWSDEKMERMTRTGASWRRMGCWRGVHTGMGFVERVPTAEAPQVVQAQVYCSVEEDEGDGYHHVLTMGNFYDWIIGALATVSKSLMTDGHDQNLNKMIWVIIWGPKPRVGSTGDVGENKSLRTFPGCRRVILRRGDKLSLEDEQGETTAVATKDGDKLEDGPTEKERQALTTIMDCFVGHGWRLRMHYMPRPDAAASERAHESVERFMCADGRDSFRTLNTVVPPNYQPTEIDDLDTAVGYLLAG